MAIRTIREEGDEILKKTSKEVEEVTDKIRELLVDMVDTMHKYNGVGLAAVQVGVLKRVIVIDLYDDNRTNETNKSSYSKAKRRARSRRRLLKFSK